MPDTIVALATPAGKSGIGVIRLSGADAQEFARALTGGRRELEPRTAVLKELRDPSTGEVIDEAVLTYFQAPNSFTGEDVVEISCHGSPVVLRRVIDICLAHGARLAEPGEFSLRALANGRMNLAEAEAIRDLIDSQTTAAARQAVRQLRGEMSQTLQPLKDELLDVIVMLESSLEFVEDDLPDFQNESIKKRLSEIADAAAKVADTHRAGHLIRDGLRVAVVGRPNVGKSSLFNALLGSDRAIVTDIAGTTRDQLHERFVVGDIPVSLIDTAGLRETSDTVESIGVERAKAAMTDADLILVVIDASDEHKQEDAEIIESVRDLNYLIVANKIDKLATKDFAKTQYKRPDAVLISAKTGEGLDALRRAIIKPFSDDAISSGGFLVTDARHHDLLRRMQAEIEQSIAALDQRRSEEITLVGLHNALRYLGEITGETTTEDMLTRIFSTFCIGK